MQDGRGIVTVPQKRFEMLAEKVVELLSKQDQIKRIGLSGKQQITEISERDIEKDWEHFFDTIAEPTDSSCRKQDYTSVVFKYLTLYQNEGKNKAINNVVKKEKAIINKLKRENKLLAKELKNAKSGYSYLIGRIITWLPRKILGKK